MPERRPRPAPPSDDDALPGGSRWAAILRTCPAMSAIAEPPAAGNAIAPLSGEAAGWGAAGSDAWQPAEVQVKGSGGAVVKFRSCSPVGAKCGVWHVSHPHSPSVVQVGQVFGGRGSSPATDTLEVAWA